MSTREEDVLMRLLLSVGVGKDEQGGEWANDVTDGVKLGEKKWMFIRSSREDWHKSRDN